jgi:hypothetical protein
MDGRATFTIVASSTTMNWATHTITSVSQGLNVRGAGEAAFAREAEDGADMGEADDGADAGEVDVGEATGGPFRRRGLNGPLSLTQTDYPVRIVLPEHRRAMLAMRTPSKNRDPAPPAGR